MAWLKGLAGKAEDFLNQIDQNAAVALQKDKKELNSTDSILTEVKWEEQRSSKKETVGDLLLHPRVKSAATLASSSPLRSSSIAMQSKNSKNDEDLINFLNGSDPLIAVGTKEQEEVQINEVNGDTIHEILPPIVAESAVPEQKAISSQRSSNRGSPQDDQPGIVSTALDEHLSTENTMLKNELRTLNSEVSQLLQRCKSAEKENWSLQKHISSLQASHVQHTQTLREKESEISVLQKEVQQAHKLAADVGMKLDGVQIENEKLLQSSGEHSRNLQDRLMVREEQLRAVHENQVGALQTRLTTLESENASQLGEVHQRLKRVEEEKLELQQQWERVRVELDEARSQLDQYRTRAQRILQDKEKLIAELRGQGSAGRSTPVDDTMELELEQLQQERELLREEVSQVSARLQASRDELQEMERRLEAGRDQASHSIQLLQDSLQEERKKRQAAEEDCRTNSEIFEKALDEPKYSSMYAQLCKRPSEEAPNFESSPNPCTFRIRLLNNCRAEFENRSKASEAFEHRDGPLAPEEEELRQPAKRKMLGNIKFIGEQGKLEILPESILHRCIHQLLVDKKKSRGRGYTKDMAEDLGFLCQIMRTYGRILDSDKRQKLMNQYFERMSSLADNQDLPLRIRFMLREVIELRRDSWVPRKATNTEGPMPVHQELRSVREEISRQRAQLAARVREREAELTRLRAQLMQRPVSPNELESRLHMLTQTLVQKQASLETVTTEKNALRLQMEKMESKHRETLALVHQLQTGVVNMNDTDDAKARVPSFLLESPFDTGMTLRVKRAYSSLDAISIRTGVFLRRYPLARILVMWYMVLLHLWVMLVLFSSTPQPQM